MVVYDFFGGVGEGEAKGIDWGIGSVENEVRKSQCGSLILGTYIGYTISNMSTRTRGCHLDKENRHFLLSSVTMMAHAQGMRSNVYSSSLIVSVV